MPIFYHFKPYQIGTLAAVESDGAVSGLFFATIRDCTIRDCTIQDCGKGTAAIRLAGKRYSLPGNAQPVRTPLLAETFRQLDDYFAGKRQQFDLPLRPSGTDFQLRVWSELQKIPYGRTVSYGEIAERIGKPKGARAVGQAVNRNPIGIIIPCHRVIGRNGQMTGFAPGVDKKIFLLNLESLHRDGNISR